MVNSDDEFPIIQDGIIIILYFIVYSESKHLRKSLIPCGKYCHQLFTISFYEFYFLAAQELSKMYWVDNLAQAEQGTWH